MDNKKAIRQPSVSGRIESAVAVYNLPTSVTIPGTKRVVKLYGMHPYTIERLTMLWVERDANLPEDSAGTAKSLAIDPYFSIKQAVLMTLNSWLKIKLFYGLKWRIWAYLRGYTEEQMTDIIQEGKKKLPLMAHWTNMVFSVDMREDWMKMTKKEAEQYQAERLSAVKQLSLKNIPNTGESGGV